MLAAGAGTRLRPLTETLPKPLAPVGGRPVVARLLEQLEVLDFDAIALNLHHGAEAVERVLRKTGRANLFHREDWLRGTAGAIRGLGAFLGGDEFLVASSDGVHEIDLAALIATHRASGAVATITVKRIERPETCAIVELDDERRVLRFVEKPAPDQVFSDLASIGVYCFAPAVIEFIPEDEPHDIAGQLIPALLDAGLPVGAYETDAWWSDIGDPPELLRANLHLGAVIDSLIDPAAVIEEPVMIGPKCSVGSEAVVSEGLVLPGSAVPRGMVVRRAIHGSGTDVLRTWLG